MAHNDWRRERCWRCDGYGLVSGWAGVDFAGPKECDACHGGGFVWLHLPSGSLAVYPGGPFVGRLGVVRR